MTCQRSDCTSMRAALNNYGPAVQHLTATIAELGAHISDLQAERDYWKDTAEQLRQAVADRNDALDDFAAALDD